MGRITDEAVCIRHWPWSETSQTVALFTAEHGVLRAVAKGSMRERGPFSGGVETLTRGGIEAIVKPAPAMALLTSWDLLDPHPGLRTSLPRFNAGNYLADLCRHAIQDGDPHPHAYAALVTALAALGGGPDRPPAGSDELYSVILAFQWALLEEVGLAPMLDHRVDADAPLPDTPTLGFRADLGGFVPDPGSNDDPDTPDHTHGDHETWRVRRGTLDALRRVADNDPEPPTPADSERAARLLAVFLASRLGVMPPATAIAFPTLTQTLHRASPTDRRPPEGR